jgi:hypothetical protein
VEATHASEPRAAVRRAALQPEEGGAGEDAHQLLRARHRPQRFAVVLRPRDRTDAGADAWKVHGVQKPQREHQPQLPLRPETVVSMVYCGSTPLTDARKWRARQIIDTRVSDLLRLRLFQRASHKWHAAHNSKGSSVHRA